MLFVTILSVFHVYYIICILYDVDNNAKMTVVSELVFKLDVVKYYTYILGLFVMMNFFANTADIETTVSFTGTITRFIYICCLGCRDL